MKRVLFAAGLLGTACLAAFTTKPAKRSVELAYHFEIGDLSPSGRTVTAWIPLPPSDAHQRLKSFHVEGPWRHGVETDPDYRNQILKLTFQGKSSPLPDSLKGRVVFHVLRKAQALPVPGRISSAEREKFLRSNRLVPTGGRIAREARQVAGSEATAWGRARKLYDHIVRTVRYDKSGKGWGRGDASWACDARRGNCTDFHSLFVGEARSLGIPARFVMGLPLPEGEKEGEISGYHCWAEFYVEPEGWVPVDASEAFKSPEKRDFYFGNLDPNRVLFSIGRDILLPSAKAGPLNYFIHPHVEVDGRPHPRVRTRFTFKG
jgi:hypothetical protein